MSVQSLLEYWSGIHERDCCEEIEAQGDGRCPFCESQRTGVSLADLMEA